MVFVNDNSGDLYAVDSNIFGVVLCWKRWPGGEWHGVRRLPKSALHRFKKWMDNFRIKVEPQEGGQITAIAAAVARDATDAVEQVTGLRNPSKDR